MQEMEKRPERAMINDVCIFGADLLHPKMVEVIEYALRKEPENNLQAIFISALGPRTRVGQYHHFSRSFVLSLPQIMEDAVHAMGTEEDVGLSVSAQIWIGLIYTIFHEVHHNVALATELGKDGSYLELDEEWHKAEEDLAQEYAEEKVEEAIIECNADVPKDILDIPWIGERVMDFLVSETKEDPEWVRAVKDRLDNGIVFENKDDIFDSLVEYFRAATQTPEKYEKENKGAAVEMVSETHNLFDKKILPGEQRELFPKNLGESVSPPAGGEGTTMPHMKFNGYGQVDPNNPNMWVQDGQIDTPANSSQKGEGPMHDDVHDHLPEEATMAPEECGSVRNDPFAPSYEPANPVQDEPSVAKRAADPFAANFPHLAAKAEAAATQSTAPVQTATWEILYGLYMRLYQQMFTGDVFTPVMLTETEKAIGLVVGCNTWNGQQTICADVTKTGAITGLKYKNGTLPCYDLIINWNGQARRMKLLAQNPDKASVPAARARAGAKIAWLIEALPNGQSEYRGCIENGVYSRCGSK